MTKTPLDEFFEVFGKHAKTNGNKKSVELALDETRTKLNLNTDEIDDLRQEATDLMYGEVEYERYY